MRMGSRRRVTVGVLAGVAALASEPAAAQSSGGGTLGDAIVAALQELLRVLFRPIEGVIEAYGDELLATVVGTPAPNTVFEAPTNGPWPELYEYYWDAIVPLALLLWALAVGLVIFFEATNHLFSGYTTARLKRRALAGLVGILSWWWIDALARRFVVTLSSYLVPSLADVSLFQTLSFTAMSVLGVVISLSVDFVLFVLIALIYVVRELALYLFTLLMPVLIALWVPGVGPWQLVSGFVRRLAGFYVPFLFMTVPVAVLFRLGDLLGQSIDLSMGGVGAWLLALVIPVLAVLAPLVLFWQAGALFFVGDRVARRVSAARARSRAARIRAAGQQGLQGGRNFLRGVRDQPAVRTNGQTVLDSGGSRAHATGARMRSVGAGVRRQLDTRRRTGANPSSPPTDGDGQQASLDQSSSTPSADGQPANGAEQSDDGPDRALSVDDPPRYLQ
jgi:hypothetical protein